MAKATSGGRETRGKLSADERRQRWPLPPPSSPGGGPPCPVTEAATPMRRATRIGSCGTVRPAIGKTGGRERAWSGRRESQEDLASLPSHSIGVVPVVTSVGAVGAADFTCLACPAGGRGNGVELRECGRRRGGGGHKTGERAAGRHRLCLCDVRLAPPAPASSFTPLSRLHSVDGAWI